MVQPLKNSRSTSASKDQPLCSSIDKLKLLTSLRLTYYLNIKVKKVNLHPTKKLWLLCISILFSYFSVNYIMHWCFCYLRECFGCPCRNDDIPNTVQTGSKQTETNAQDDIDPLLSEEVENVAKASTDIQDHNASDQVNDFCCHNIILIKSQIYGFNSNTFCRLVQACNFEKYFK